MNTAIKLKKNRANNANKNFPSNSIFCHKIKWFFQLQHSRIKTKMANRLEVINRMLWEYCASPDTLASTCTHISAESCCYRYALRFHENTHIHTIERITCRVSLVCSRYDTYICIYTLWTEWRASFTSFQVVRRIGLDAYRHFKWKNVGILNRFKIFSSWSKVIVSFSGKCIRGILNRNESPFL